MKQGANRLFLTVKVGSKSGDRQKIAKIANQSTIVD
jgi:hypothetical protein